jgi:flagellar motor protein MotB
MLARWPTNCPCGDAGRFLLSRLNTDRQPGPFSRHAVSALIFKGSRMRVVPHSLLLLVVLVLAGCAQNPYVLQGQMGTLQQQQSTLAQQNQQLQSKASTLDQDNQELEALLAQARQQNKLLQDQVALMRDQLQSVNGQLAQTRDEKATIEKKTHASLASQARIGASITPNNSLQKNLPQFAIPGVEARQDGDVIRIELPCDKMFDSAGARLRMDSTPMIETVVAEIDRRYPGQFIGIESHTDSDPPPSGSQWLTNHQLSAARAQAVFDYLVARTKLKAEQLFIVGHGGNHPLVSNGTAAGKARNRRIELAIYPDRAWQ